MSTIKQVASSSGIIEVRAEVPRYFADADEALPFFEAPDICIIDFDQDLEKALLTGERVHKVFGQTAIFAASSNPAADRIISAMQCGCGEYLVKPLDPEVLTEGVVRVWRKKREKSDRPAGQVMAFVGTKGGCGVTTLATHLAALLAKTRKTLLIDHHPQLGDISFYLALQNPQYHFTELVESTHRLDADFLQGFIVQHKSGLDVLPSPDKFDATLHVSPEGVERTLDFLRSQYEFVLVDCPPGLSARNVAMFNHSDQVYLVAVPEIPALRNATRYLDDLLKHGYPMDRARLVINRHSQEGTISDAAIERAIHKPIYWKVPNEYDEVVNTINSGHPTSLSADSALMRNLTGWAEAIASRQTRTGDQAQPSKQKQDDKGGLRLRIVGG